MTPSERQQARELIRLERAMWSEADPHAERTNADVQAAVDLLESALDASHETSGDAQKSRQEQPILYTREQLISICERGIVQEKDWHDRDSPGAQTTLYQVLGLLKAGCRFSVTYEGDSCVTDDRTIWLHVFHKTFGTFEYGGPEEEIHAYLPTEKRLAEAAGKDWY